MAIMALTTQGLLSGRHQCLIRIEAGPPEPGWYLIWRSGPVVPLHFATASICPEPLRVIIIGA